METTTPGFKFQSCSFLAICTYPMSLSLNPPFRKTILIFRVALRSKYFLKRIQPFVNGAAIMVMMTDIKAVIFVCHQFAEGFEPLCSPCTFNAFYTFSLPPSSPSTSYSTLSMLIFLLAKDQYVFENKVSRKYLFRNIHVCLVGRSVLAKGIGT